MFANICCKSQKVRPYFGSYIKKNVNKNLNKTQTITRIHFVTFMTSVPLLMRIQDVILEPLHLFYRGFGTQTKTILLLIWYRLWAAWRPRFLTNLRSMLKAAEVRKKALLAWCFFLSMSLSFFRCSCFWLLISFQFIPFTSSLDSCFSSPFFLYPPLWRAPPAPSWSNFWFGGVLICYSRLGFWALKGVDFGNMFLSFTEEVPQCPMEWLASKHTNRNHSAFPLQGSREARKTWSWVAWIWSCLLICDAAHWFCLICSIQNGWAPKLWGFTSCVICGTEMLDINVFEVSFFLEHVPSKVHNGVKKIPIISNNVHTQYHQYLSVWLPRSQISQVTKNQRRVEKIPAAARISVSCDILRGMDRCFVQGSQGDCDLVYEVGLWKICETSNVEAMWIVNLLRLTRKAQQDAQEVQKLRAELDTLQKWDVKSDFALFWAIKIGLKLIGLPDSALRRTPSEPGSAERSKEQSATWHPKCAQKTAMI